MRIPTFLRLALFIVTLAALIGQALARRRTHVQVQVSGQRLAAEEILQQVGRIPLWHWVYRDQPYVPHIGPMAQDFAAFFQLGDDPRRISVIDALGVLFAAVQALYRQMESNRLCEGREENS